MPTVESLKFDEKEIQAMTWLIKDIKWKLTSNPLLINNCSNELVEEMYVKYSIDAWLHNLDIIKEENLISFVTSNDKNLMLNEIENKFVTELCGCLLILHWLSGGLDLTQEELIDEYRVQGNKPSDYV